MIVFALIVSFPFYIHFTVEFFYLWKYHLLRSGKAKVMQINYAGLVANVEFAAPREPRGGGGGLHYERGGDARRKFWFKP